MNGTRPSSPLVLALIAALALPLLAPPAAGGAEPAKDFAPLVGDLTELDKIIDKALERLAANDVEGSNVQLDLIFGADSKPGLIEAYEAKIGKLGPKYSGAYRAGRARGWISQAGAAFSVDAARQNLQSAKSDVQRATKDLREGDAPQSVLDSLAKLEKQLDAAIEATYRNDLDGVKRELRKLTAGEVGTAIKKLDPDVYDVYRLWEVWDALNLARFAASQDSSAVAEESLERAKTVKEAVMKVLEEKSRCSINGTPGKDNLKGTKGANTICGQGGNDKIDGKGGSDIIKGGNGNDSLKGGVGDDKLDGGKGNDKLDGGAGDDSLKGGKGKDKLNGGSGNDKLDGGPEKDELRGELGLDDCPTTGGDTSVDCETPVEGPVCTVTLTYVGPATDNEGHQLTDPAAGATIQCNAAIVSTTATFANRQIKSCQDASGPCEKASTGGANDTAVFRTAVPANQGYSFSVTTDPAVQRSATPVKMTIQTDRGTTGVDGQL